MRRAGVVLAALVLAAACGPGPFVRRGRLNVDALAEVRAGLPAVRGLAFRAPVPAVVLDPEGIAAAMARDLDESYQPGDLDRIQAVYERLGLLPGGTPLGPAIERLYEEEGAGFYDPRRKELMLASRALRAGGFWIGLLGRLTGRDLVGEFLVAHELTHALQDQHYGLPTTPDPLIASHGDRELARHALLEGDATLAGFAYVRGGLDDRTIEATVANLRGVPVELAERYPDVPEIVRATVAFQYDAGSAFVAWALSAGGWAAVDRCHRDPPASTEQVLHPARYFGLRDEPVDVAVGGTRALERAGWTTVVEDTLGEFQLRVLAGRVLDANRAARVADGWGGDRLRALARGDDLLVVWMTAWDSPAEAAEFADALPAILPAAYDERRGDRVLVVLPAGDVEPAALAARVWRETLARQRRSS